jgi:hypothetical protein
MDTVLAYQQTAAIKAAIELDLFSEIAKGKNTADKPRADNRSGGSRYPHTLRARFGPKTRP